MNVYLSEKEVMSLLTVCGQWMELMETAEEDIITPMLDSGLGSALYKLYKGRNGQKLYEEYKGRGGNGKQI